MTTYVDPLRDYGWRLGPSCHLIADTQEELHEVAAAVGMKRRWFQSPPRASAPHYDLVANRRRRAVELGAVELDQRGFVEVVRRLRAAGWP